MLRVRRALLAVRSAHGERRPRRVTRDSPILLVLSRNEAVQPCNKRVSESLCFLNIMEKLTERKRKREIVGYDRRKMTLSGNFQDLRSVNSIVISRENCEISSPESENIRNPLINFFTRRDNYRRENME